MGVCAWCKVDVEKLGVLAGIYYEQLSHSVINCQVKVIYFKGFFFEPFSLLFLCLAMTFDSNYEELCGKKKSRVIS